jgi:hypothetical protein
MFGQMPAWLHATLTKKEKNGRKLYRLLFAHNLCSDHVNHLANKMEARLASLTYRGKQKNWDRSCYTDAHIKQHTIAKNLIEHGYSGLDKCSKARHLLTGIQDNAVQPVVCQVLAMREEEKTFTACLALFADFIRHLKQNPSNCAALPSSAALDEAAVGVVTPEEEVVADVDMAARAAVEAQAKADLWIKLRWTRSLGFRPTSTTPPRNMQSSLQPRRHGSTSTTRCPQQSSAKLLLCRAAMTTPPGNRVTMVTSLMTTTMRAFCPGAPLGRT